MCVGEAYSPNGKHAILVIYVRGNTQAGETHITMTPPQLEFNTDRLES